MSDPLVSVVVTTFDTGPYVLDTLESVFAQSYDNYEVIVVDDGSRDDTLERVRPLVPRIRLLEREHEGLGPARNAGLALARGDYVAFLDSDDLWDPDALQVQVATARRNPASGLIVGDGYQFAGDTVLRERLLPPWIAELVDAEADGCVTGSLYRRIVRASPASCPGQALVPRAVVDDIGGVCDTPNGAQDFDYYLRIARRYPITFHRGRVVGWRFRDESMSGRGATRGLRWAAQAMVVYEREAAACAPEDRELVLAAMRHRARSGVADAARSRIEEGIVPDREQLAVIARHARRDPVVLWARLALAMPAPLDVALLRTTRSARRSIARARTLSGRLRTRTSAAARRRG